MSDPTRIPMIPSELLEREQSRRNSSLQEYWNALDQVMDPEIPVISIWELGVLQNVQLRGDTVIVTITPTYSGCPAMQTIAEDIQTALAAMGRPACEIETRLAPAWSSNWIGPEAQEKLRLYGIAPPGLSPDQSGPLSCPHCASEQLRLVSEFGSTACKALYQCDDCGEPFDHFKNF